MANLLRGALVGAIALGGVAMASDEASAMPVGNLAPAVSTEAGQQLKPESVYWRYGWGWRRPGWRYGYGWRRPFGWGGYHPWGWGYHRWHRWRRW